MAATMDYPFDRCTISANNSSFRQQNPHAIKPPVLAGLPIFSPKSKLVQFFLSGLVQGFRIGFNNSINSLRSARKNLQGATFHPEVVDKSIKDEVALNRVYVLTLKPYAPQCTLADLALFKKSPAK